MARRNSPGTLGGLYGGDARGLYSSSAHRNMMIYGKPPRRWPKVLLVIAIVLIIAGCICQFACGGLPFLNAEEAQQSEQNQEQGSETDTSQEGSGADSSDQSASTTSQTDATYQEGVNTTITISAVGDCTLGTDVDFDEDTNFTSVYEKNNAKYFFKNVNKFTKKDDLTIANLEGPLTSSDDIQDKSFNFKGPAEYADILVQGGVEAVNLANNHSYDYGEQGYEDTKDNLSKYKVTSFGYDRTAVTTINNIKVGMFGINQLTDETVAKEQMEEDIKALQKENCALIVGSFHWGIEGNNEAEDYQVTLAHAAIDEGCDLVIGSHPHVLQGIEMYKDRFICYSMGNFVFGGNDSPGDYDTMIFQQTFTFENGQLVINNDTKKNANVIPCSVSSSSEINNYKPSPLRGNEGKTLIKKINKFSKALAGTSVEISTTQDVDGVAKVK